MAKDIAPQPEGEFRGKPYTKKEAEEATFQFVRSGVEVRHRLLDLYERRAHHVLGFASFEEYAKDRLGLDVGGERLSRLRRWARTELTVRGIVDEDVDANQRMRRLEEIAKQPIPENAALELGKLPHSEQREAWDESLAVAAQDHSQLSRVKFIVNRRLEATRGNYPEPRPESEIKPYVAPRSMNSGMDYGASPPQIAPVTAPKPENAPGAATEDNALETPAEAQEQALWGRRQAALQAALGYVRMRRIDGSISAAVRRELSAEFVRMGVWIAEGK